MPNGDRLFTPPTTPPPPPEPPRRPWYEQIFPRLTRDIRAYPEEFGRGMQWLTGQYQPPAAPMQVSPRTGGIFERAGQPLDPSRVAPPTPAQQAEAMRALGQVGQPGAPGVPGVPGAPPAGITPRAAMTYEEAKAMQQRLGPDYYLDYDEDIGGYRVERKPMAAAAPGMSEWQREQIRIAEEEATRGEEARFAQEKLAAMEESRRKQELALQREQMQMQQEQWQQQMGWQQQQAQMQQQEQERQERARLSAQPMSWLQYAAYTGEQPMIQPWMAPLMAQQYPEIQVGQQIPGWTPEGGRAMPQLTTPSAQLWGRMGPTSQAQYAGYRQARTGIRPEETAFRMQAGAPPGGRGPGLRWTR